MIEISVDAKTYKHIVACLEIGTGEWCTYRGKSRKAWNDRSKKALEMIDISEHNPAFSCCANCHYYKKEDYRCTKLKTDTIPNDYCLHHKGLSK